MNEPLEADITISGQPLTKAQSMTVRVALQIAYMTIKDQGPGISEEINAGYLRAIKQINKLIAKTAR
jgi:hypothetical protein